MRSTAFSVAIFHWLWQLFSIDSNLRKTFWLEQLRETKVKRAPVLDGLRGVAIILVIIFHYFGRWADEAGGSAYPFGDFFSRWPIASDGYVGVYLFFIISGYVIFFSLKRSSSALNFLAKRADRLVLPMVVLSSITLLLLAGPLRVHFLQAEWSFILPSWTFTSPDFWRWADPNVRWVDGAYWTLYAEVRFYLVMAIIWIVARENAALAMCLFALTGMLIFFLAKILMLSDFSIGLISNLFFPYYSALFAAGVAYSEMSSGKQSARLMLVALIPASALGAALLQSAPLQMFTTVAWVLCWHFIFFGFSTGKKWVSVFGLKPLAMVGTVSYSLYLFHQNVGISIIYRIPKDWSLAGQVSAVLALIVGMLVVAFLSWKYIEQRRPFSTLRWRVRSIA